MSRAARPSMVAGAAVARVAAERVLGRVLARARSDGRPLVEVVGETLFHERERLARHGVSARTSGDRAFIEALGRELGAALDAAREQAREGRERAHDGAPDRAAALVQRIALRYAHEIEGHFDPRVFAFATRALPLGLTALLNGTRVSEALFRVPELSRLSDRVRISGELSAVRRAFEHATVIVAPTHVSNLDSVLLGYALHRSGLPPVAYGAGLNLFESRVLGFFMRNLGAYTVDRTKSDPLYRAVLKEYATVLLEEGQHGLFFPGGTRSRSFALERRLKKGLLGTALVAYHQNLVSRCPKPGVLIVPATLSYPLVLEAQSLAEDFLLRSGRERYVHPERDESDRWERWLGFMNGLFALDADLELRLGRPLDPFGCEVGDDGRSRDPRGRVLDAADYLRRGGELVLDPARDAAYTELLEARLVAAYERDSVALPTWALSFAALEAARRAAGHEHLYRLLRALPRGARLPLGPVARLLGEVLAELRRREAEGRVTRSVELSGDASQVLERALRVFATYHEVPVLRRDGAELVVGDASLLYFYRNRLAHLGLVGAPALLPDDGA
jgi:glycerol-3-phosphate O-acyltransferase